MWYNALLSRGLIPDFLLRRGVKRQGKQRLQMMGNNNSKNDYNKFLSEASSGDIAVQQLQLFPQHFQ
jgi:hypothetical protein